MEQSIKIFDDLVADALKKYEDPQWLGNHSPLAAPYFLGDRLAIEAGTIDAKVRGEVLQRLLRESVSQLRGDEASHHRRLIEVSFMQGRRTLEGVWDEFNLSRAQFFVHRKRAVAQLANQFIQQVNPALRLETAPHTPVLIGVTSQIDHCLQVLARNQSAAIRGGQGSGKSAFGASVARQLFGRPIFWFTVRSGLNDRLHSLLFALGYFLHQLGASTLWLQLVANTHNPQIDWEIILALTRHALEQLRPTPPLLCFDEIDLLRPREIQEHGQIITFLESLQGLAPLLLIGQHPPLAVDHYHVMRGLTLEEIQTFLSQLQIHLPAPSCQQLHHYTQGNPRLLHLFATLLIAAQTEHSAAENPITAEKLSELITSLPTTPSVEALFQRVWQRLHPQEQQILAQLTVFRRPVPEDAFPERAERFALHQLLERQLVQQDQTGGVALPPLYRAILNQHLAAADREQLHLFAAQVRSERGEYTAAAYHLIQAGESERALELWHMHKEQEINQGQAGQALALLRTISPRHLSETKCELLSLLLSELQLLAGEYAQARNTLQITEWKTPVLQIDMHRLRGDLDVMEGDEFQAIAHYQQGLRIAETLASGMLPRLHKDIGWVLMRQRESERAWREAQLARYEAENFQGFVQMGLGHYAEALAYFRSALEWASAIQHRAGEAKTCTNLMQLLASTGDFAEAQNYWQQAQHAYETIGDITALAGLKLNWATTRHLAGAAREALPVAKEALTLFQQLRHRDGRLAAAQTLSEVHLALNELEPAEQYAWQVVQSEQNSTLPDALRVLGEIKTAGGDYPSAEQFIQDAIDQAQQNHDPYLEAYAWRALGRLYEAWEKCDAANQARSTAVERFMALGLVHEVETMGEEADNKLINPNR